MVITNYCWQYYRKILKSNMRYYLTFFFALSFIINAYSIDYDGHFIAHSGGEIDGITYTNSLEALNYSYDKGFRYFELDLVEDVYGNVLAAHDWNHWKSITRCDSVYQTQKCDTTTTIVKLDSVSISINCDTAFVIDGVDTLNTIIECDTSYTTVEYDTLITNIDCNTISHKPTEEHFLTHKLYNKYTPLNMDMINQWFSEHTDAVLVTDKINDPEKMSSLFVDDSRLYMELFSFEAIEKAKTLGINYMMSENVLYMTGNNKLEYLIDNEIPAIAVSRRLIDNEQYKALFSDCTANDIKVWFFHVNYDIGKDEKYVYENEMQYIYGMYADKWIDEFEVKVSAQEIYSDNLKVYYAEDLLTIESDKEIKSISLYNVSGKLLAHYDNINSLDFQTLIENNDGLMILQIVSTDVFIAKIHTKK